MKAFSFHLEPAELLLFAIAFMGQLMGSAVISECQADLTFLKFA